MRGLRQIFLIFLMLAWLSQTFDLPALLVRSDGWCSVHKSYCAGQAHAACKHVHMDCPVCSGKQANALKTYDGKSFKAQPCQFVQASVAAQQPVLLVKSSYKGVSLSLAYVTSTLLQAYDSVYLVFEPRPPRA